MLTQSPAFDTDPDARLSELEDKIEELRRREEIRSRGMEARIAAAEAALQGLAEQQRMLRKASQKIDVVERLGGTLGRATGSADAQAVAGALSRGHNKMSLRKVFEAR